MLPHPHCTSRDGTARHQQDDNGQRSESGHLLKLRGDRSRGRVLVFERVELRAQLGLVERRVEKLIGIRVRTRRVPLPPLPFPQLLIQHVRHVRDACCWS